MNKYEENVKTVADQMAKIRFPRVVAMIDSGSIFYKKSWFPDYVEPMMPLATQVVHLEAEAYQAGYMSNFPENTEEEEKMWLSNCEWEMIEKGLIPPKTETE